jgi:hypothetical protein
MTDSELAAIVVPLTIGIVMYTIWRIVKVVYHRID